MSMSAAIPCWARSFEGFQLSNRRIWISCPPPVLSRIFSKRRTSRGGGCIREYPIPQGGTEARNGRPPGDPASAPSSPSRWSVEVSLSRTTLCRSITVAPKVSTGSGSATGASLSSLEIASHCVANGTPPAIPVRSDVGRKTTACCTAPCSRQRGTSFPSAEANCA